MINYHHLFYFYTIVNKKSFTKAAEDLKIRQPSLSAQIKSLEEYLGYSLLDRNGKRTLPTPQGEVIFRFCSRIFEAGRDLENFIQNRPETQFRKLRIGVSEQIDSTFVADIFSKLVRIESSYPFSLRVLSGRKNELMEALKSQNLDLVLANSPGREDELLDLSEVNMPVGLFISVEKLKKLKLKKIQTPVKDLLNLKSLSLVMPTERLVLRHQTDTFLARIGSSYHLAFESDLLPVVARAVLEGIGAGFLPVPYMKEELSLGLVKMIGKEKHYWTQKLYLIGRKNLEHDQRVKDLARILTAEGD